MLDQAIDTVYTNLKDLEGLRCLALAGSGFTMIVALPRFCGARMGVVAKAQPFPLRRVESETSADTGFDGKLTIHPAHWLGNSEQFAPAADRSRGPALFTYSVSARVLHRTRSMW